MNIASMEAEKRLESNGLPVEDFLVGVSAMWHDYPASTPRAKPLATSALSAEPR